METFILMADIVSSRRKNAKKTMDIFKSIVEKANTHQSKNILSPLTITLGDEFQGLIKDCTTATEIIIFLEEELIKAKTPFRLRYVLNHGEIETPVNKKIAYGMMGEGLTRTREALSDLKNDKDKRFQMINLKESNQPLENTFLLFQSITSDWKPADSEIISDFINGLNYREVAAKHDKVPSLTWKRRRSLKINEYFALKELIKYLSQKC